MKLQQLKYIVEIADCRSITRAAQKLFVSQPYLSKVVADFEARIKKQIFIRHNQGLDLTADGQKVYLLAQSIIAQMELLDHLETDEMAQPDSVRLSFSVGNFMIKDSLLLDYLSTSHAARNEIDFHETTIEACLRHVEGNVSEFAILVADDFQKTLLERTALRRGVDCIELDEGALYCHLHRNHSLADQAEITISSLLQYPLVRLPEDQYTRFSRTKLKEEYPDLYVRRCIVVSHYHSCLNLVQNSGAFMIGNKWQISGMERVGIQSIRFSSLRHKAHLMLLKKELTAFSPQAKRFLHLFRDGYGLDAT